MTLHRLKSSCVKLKRWDSLCKAFYSLILICSPQSEMSQTQLIRIFCKYARGEGNAPAVPVIQPTTPPVAPKTQLIESTDDKTKLPAPSAEALKALAPASHTSLAEAISEKSKEEEAVVLPPTGFLTVESFTAFLLSADNSPFVDHHGKIYHDMSRPLSDYYISSSHNTYLVGNQLVGDSTTEGYIRALLQGCRSVERTSPYHCVESLLLTCCALGCSGYLGRR